MVWEQDIPLMVMLTDLLEKKGGLQVKADMYWPRAVGDVKVFGKLRVKLVGETQRGAVIVRKMRLWQKTTESSSSSSEPSDRTPSFSHSGTPPPMAGTPPPWESGDGSGSMSDYVPSSSSSEEMEPVGEGAEVRTCIQLHCKKWPDFGVLESMFFIEELVREITIHKKSPEQPVLLHCSAGIGRTGTLLAILASLHRELCSEEINLKATVIHLRTMRLGMVQSIAQYKFIYQMVADLLKLRQEYCHPAAHLYLRK